MIEQAFSKNNFHHRILEFELLALSKTSPIDQHVTDTDLDTCLRYRFLRFGTPNYAINYMGLHHLVIQHSCVPVEEVQTVH